MSLNGVIADLQHNDRQVRLHGTTTPWRLVVDFHVRFNFTNVRNEAAGRIDRWDQEPRWLSAEAQAASTLPAANPNESAQWKARFIQVVGNSWSHRWLLEPNTTEAACTTFGGCGPVPQNVDVILNVRDVGSGAAVDAAPSGVRVHLVRVYKARYNTRYDTVSRRLELGYYDNLLTPSPGGPMQVAAVHEVGHALGMDHPGEDAGRAECSTEGNPGGIVPLSCYEADGDSRMVMGAGMHIRSGDYQVFAHIINALLRENERGFRYRPTNNRPGTHTAAPGVNQCPTDRARYGDMSWPENPGPTTACSTDELP